jgi:hypothetical protein
MRLRAALAILLMASVSAPTGCAEQPGRKKVNKKGQQAGLKKRGVNPQNRNRARPRPSGQKSGPAQ